MITRGPFPLDAFAGKDLSPLVRAYLELNQLKQLFRQGWLRRGLPPERCETVAEHVFSMALLAWWAVDLYAPALDRRRVVDMVLAHELGEVYTGDIVPADGILPEEKHRRERQAVIQVLDGLPSGPEILALWDEYAAGQTGEARFVRQIDRLEMALQAAAYQAQGFERMEEFLASGRAALKDANLLSLLDSIIKPD